LTAVQSSGVSMQPVITLEILTEELPRLPFADYQEPDMKMVLSLDLVFKTFFFETNLTYKNFFYIFGKSSRIL